MRSSSLKHKSDSEDFYCEDSNKKAKLWPPPLTEEKVCNPSISTTFGVRRRLLGARDELLNSKQFLNKELRIDYHLAIFTAAIKALNCEVVEIAGNDSCFLVEEEYRFVRDPVVVFHDKKMVISCKDNAEFGSKDILNKFADYKHIMINHAYFEGGNVFYLPFINKVFHGTQPGGYYAKKDGLVLSEMTPENYYKVPPTETNQSLYEQLHPYGIDIEGLELDTVVLAHSNHFKVFISKDYYYHLDCFMQLLPDGRLIILNKKILSEASWRKLESLLGDKFIDIAYPEYLTHPIILNFIVINREGNLFLIAPNLPKSIRDTLDRLNLSVITPETLTFGNEYYQENYARKVAEILQHNGYEKATADNLATKIVKNKHGYRCHKGKTITYSELTSWSLSLSKYCKYNPISFVVGGGGPHCLTTEIVPNLPNVSHNDHTLFNQSTAVKQSSTAYHFSRMSF